MKIFAFFNSDNKFISRLVEGDDFSSFGDSSWHLKLAQMHMLGASHHQEISEADLQLYLTGNYQLGDDGTPLLIQKSNDELIADIVSENLQKIDELKESVVLASLQGMDVSDLQIQYNNLIEQSNQQILQLVGDN